MINWTIGQLGLGAARVPGMGPQGTGKDKGGSAKVEVDLCSCLHLVKICADFERKAVYSQLHQLHPSANISVSHFERLMYVCVKLLKY